MSAPQSPVSDAVVEIAADALGEPYPGYGARAVVDALAAGGWLCDPPGRRELNHAGRAADHVLALVGAQEPEFHVTAEMHDRMVELVHSVVRLVAGGAR